MPRNFRPHFPSLVSIAGGGTNADGATGVFTFLYTMAMQDTDLTGVGGYVSGAALAANTKIEIRAHRLADDEVTILDNYQTQPVVFRRDL